jgi:hypothetical protein
MSDTSGLKNAVKVERIKQSGSINITTKNSFGVHIFSGSVDDDGIISARLTRPNYDNTELIKTVDTSIFELIPKVSASKDDLVPRVWWTDEQTSHNKSKDIIKNQSVTIDALNAKISELYIVTQSLRVDLDAQSLLAASAQNQSMLSTTRVKTSAIDLQNAIQKSTSEVIQRVSISAINKIHEDEIISLKEQLFGRTSKIQEGYKVAKDFAVKVVEVSEPSLQNIVFEAMQAGSNVNVATWINGPTLNIYNYSSTDIVINLKTSGAAVNILNMPSSVIVKSNSSYDIVLSAKNMANIKRSDTDGDYRGSLTLTSNTSLASVTLSTAFHTVNGNKFSTNATVYNTLDLKK